MQKPNLAKVERLRALTPRSLNTILLSTILAFFSIGLAVDGVIGITIALMILCVIGSMLQLWKRTTEGREVMDALSKKVKFSFQTFFLSMASWSLINMMVSGGFDVTMRYMAVWAMLLCLLSPVIHFSAKQWRGIALAGSAVAGAFLAAHGLDLIAHGPEILLQPLRMHEATMPYWFFFCGLGSLSLVSLALVGFGKLARRLNAKLSGTIVSPAVTARQKFMLFVSRADRQLISELPVYAFFAWYLSLVFFLSVPNGSIGDMVANTLIASARDANLMNYEVEPSKQAKFVKAFLALPPEPFDTAYVSKQKMLTAAEAELEFNRHTYKGVERDVFAEGSTEDLEVKIPPFMALVGELPPAYVNHRPIALPAAYPTKESLEVKPAQPPNGTPAKHVISYYSPKLMGLAPSAKLDSEKELQFIITTVKSVVALSLLILPFALVCRFANFYADLTRRWIGCTGAVRFSEAALAAVRNSGDKLRLKYESRFGAQVASSFWWLLFWYVLAFWMVAFCPGGLGGSFRSWLDASLFKAGFFWLSTENNMQLRLFMAAFIAMNLSGPLAVTGCVFLPYRSGRQIIVGEDGISVPDGPFVQMWFRTFRLYVDIKSISLTRASNPEYEDVSAPNNSSSEQTVDRAALQAKVHASDKRRLKISFRTGGSLSFRVMDMPPEDLRLLLERIDEHAEDCALSPSVIDLRVKLSKDADGKTDNANVAKRGKFKSSIFVPYAGGEKILHGNLRVVKVLANKPLSAVYLVRTEQGSLAILKQLVMPKDDDVSKEHLRIFERECELMRELQHDGIARVLDVFSENNNYFLLLEHSKGQDLKTVVETYGARKLTEVAQWGLYLCDVLEYLHSKGIVHRDITPENIVLGEQAAIRLIDFGAAHQFIEGITGTLIGKQSYVAPEQLRGKATTGSDIYSLGVTFNYLLTAKEPVALMQCSPDLGKGNSAELMRTLISSMTEFDEENRPENIHTVRRILLAVLNLKDAPATSFEKTEATKVAELANGEQSLEPESEEQLAERTIKMMSDVLPPVEPSLSADYETIDLTAKEKVEVHKVVEPKNN